MREENYIFIMGQECELRPITAMELIKARSEGALYASGENADDDAREIITWAHILSRGIYSDGMPLFADGVAVLNNLTPAEIAFAAQEYAYTLPNTQKDNENKTMPQTHTLGRHMENLEKKQVVYGESTQTEKTTEIEYLAEISRSRRGAMTSYAQTQSIQGDNYTPDMQAVSDFFERDSRRYDGRIENY